MVGTIVNQSSEVTPREKDGLRMEKLTNLVTCGIEKFNWTPQDSWWAAA